jgi:hypothetical protein
MVYNISRKVALSYVGDIASVDDIVQLTLIQFYLNEAKIIESKIFSWVYKVTKNFCMQFFNKCKRDLMLSKNLRYYTDDFNIFTDNNNIPEIEHPDPEFNIDSYDFLSAQDKKLFKQYYFDKIELSILSRNYKMKKKNISYKLNSMIKEIKQFHILSEQHFAFDPIIGSKLYRNMENLKKTITKAIKENNFKKFRHYFKDCIINENIEKIRIESIAKYRISVTDKGNYNLVVLYIDHEKRVKFFALRFNIIDGAKINVLEIPIIPQEVVVYKREYAEGKSGMKRLSDRNGRYNSLYGSHDEMLKKCIVKVVQTYKDFQ